MICLYKDFIKILTNKLNLNDFYDLIILHKLTLCKNFYIMMKKIDSRESDNSSNNKNLQILCEKNLDHVLLNRKGNLNLDSNTYFLLLNIHNM